LDLTDPPKVRAFIEENSLIFFGHLFTSPDLNLIELIWGRMKDKIEGLDIKSQSDSEILFSKLGKKPRMN